MKLTKRRFSNSAVSVLLALCLLASCFTVALIPTDAARIESEETGATDSTVYIVVSDSVMASIDADTVKVNVKCNQYSGSGGDNEKYTQTTASSSNKFYNGMRIYTATGIEGTGWGGCGEIKVQLYNGDTWKEEKTAISFTANTWHAQSEYNGKLFNYSTGAFVGDYSEATHANGFSTGDYYIYNNITGTWYGVGNSPKMTKSGNTYYYDFYLKKNEVDTTNYVIFKFWDASDELQIGPDYEDDHRCTLSTSGSWSSTVQSISNYNDKDTAWQVNTSGWTANKYYKLRITLDGVTLDNENSRNGRVKFEATQLADLDPTFSTTTFTVGTSYNLTSLVGVTSNSNVGTVSYSSYQYYDTAWHTISSPSSWTPDSTSITKLKVTASDGGVITTSGTSKNAITARSEEKETSITVNPNTFTVNISAKTEGTVSTTGGTVSPASYSGLIVGHPDKSITATPNTANNYVFAGWTSENGNVTFDNASSASTTFSATAADTIYANFTQETLYPVTVYADGSTSSTVNAGATINPEITRVDRSLDDYDFTGWTLTGDVALASGYSASNPTIKITATGTGGTVTANYNHVDYIYFYGALQSNWNSNPVVTVDGTQVQPFAWIAEYGNSELPAKTLYSGSDANTQIGNYYIGIYRVPVAKKNKAISVFNCEQTGTNSNMGYCGTVQDAQGCCYYTYSNGTDQNHSGSISPQKVNSITLSSTENSNVSGTLSVDADETVNVSKTQTVYSGTKTAGQDDFTYTYELVNASTNAVVKDLRPEPSQIAGNYGFVPADKSIGAGTYKVQITTRDAKTQRIHNTCQSSAFTVCAAPTQSTVTASVTNGSVTSRSYTYKGGSATSFDNGASLRAGSNVTLTFTLSDGYTQGTTTATGISSSALTESYNSSTRVLTITFTVPSGGTAITISHTAQEVMHTVTLVRRYYNSDGTATIASNVTQGTISAGISTTASTGNAPAQTDYTFKKFVLPSSGVTKVSGDLNNATAITVNATADNKTIYLDYWETVYDITVQNDGHGTVSRGSTTITSGNTTKIGNVTAITLTAVNSSGYKFKEWQITKSGTATTANVNGTEYTLGSSATVISGESYAESTFKFNGTATVKAVFEPVAYSISASFPSGNSYVNTNSVRVTNSSGTTISSGNIGNVFEIRVTLEDGYEVASITGTGITSTLPTPTVTNGVYRYSYTMGASSVVATVTLKAKKPTLSNVQIKNNNSGFPYATYSSGDTVPHYYKQPDVAKATTDAFSTLEYSNVYRSVIGKASGAEASLDANPDNRPSTEDGTVTYTLTVTARNHKAGVDDATTSQTFTIQVSYNLKQKAYFKLDKIYGKLLREATSGNAYYSDAATQIATYNTAYDAATAFRNNDWPAYNDTASTTVYTDLTSALTTLMSKANLTKVYILSNVANTSTSSPVNVTYSTNGNDTDWKHVMMFSIYDELREIDRTKILDSFDNYAFHASYDGVVKNNSGTNTYYLYTISYAGRANFQIWRGSTADDAASVSTGKLTGEVANATDIGEKYYVDVYDISAGSGSATTCSVWRDFGHERTTTGKQFLEIGNIRTGAQIKDMFGIQETGSVIDSRRSANVYKNNTVFTIEGPVGKASSEEVDLTSANFTSPEQGKYKITYKTEFGDKASGGKYDATAIYYLYVAYDDVTVYVDMNNNVGTPILNFNYKADANGLPVSSGGTDAYLPYEMDLMTGSESVYKYTVKTSKLRDDYHIAFSSLTPLNISYITVENRKIGLNAGGFDITNDARISGEVWLKANSTHLTTFKTLAYGAVTSSFVAVTEDSNHKVISAAINSMHGTGIVTDDDEIYHAKYAASGTDNCPDKFNYVLNLMMNSEAKNSGNTYYFDRWVRIETPEEGLTVDTNGKLAKNDLNKTLFALTQATEYSEKQDLTFTEAFPYSDGGGDYTYVALYKLATTGDSTVRVEVTYEFNDYDTSDGNYIFDAAVDQHGNYLKVVPASYTKTIKVTGMTFAQVQSNLETIVSANAPYIKSNYFDYTYTANSVSNIEATEAQSKIKVKATFTETPHTYSIIVKNGSTSYTQINQVDISGTYQNTVVLNKNSFGGENFSNPVWTDANDKVLAVGDTYTARFVASGFETGDGTPSGTDCQIVKLSNQSGVSVTHTSVVTNSTTTVENSGTNEVLHHNFYIVDYCQKGELVGGGVLFATGTYSGNTWSYRQNSATTNLADATARKNFISGILNNDYDTEYTAQSINNIGFRYKPFKETEDVFRYSDIQQAYQTVYEGTNVNSTNYAGQKLRLFSFMVYKTGNTYDIIPSEGYGEVDRYIDFNA